VWTVHSLLDNTHIVPAACPRGAIYQLRILEPCVGDGSIVNAVNESRRYYGRPNVDWVTVDIKDHGFRHPNHLECDFLDNRCSLLRPPSRFDLAMTNPPFEFFDRFLAKCRRICDEVIFLERLNWLETVERNDDLRDDYPNVYVLSPRPSFRESGETDSTAYAWFHWPKEPQSNGIIETLPTWYGPK
jgi:hypothetical protein